MCIANPDNLKRDIKELQEKLSRAYDRVDSIAEQIKEKQRKLRSLTSKKARADARKKLTRAKKNLKSLAKRAGVNILIVED